MTGVCVNLRCLQGPSTGVQRYVGATVKRLNHILEPIAPGKPLQGMAGHCWEQAILPVRVKRRLLWSPANVGPLLVQRQVVTVHDLAFLDIPSSQTGRFRSWYSFLIPRLARKVRHVIVVSEFSKSRLLHWSRVAPTQVSVIPNGVEHEIFYPYPRKKAPPYVLTVGTLEPRKNLAPLLEAWKQASPKLPGVELRVAGGRGKSTVFAEQKIHTPPSCNLLGRVSDEELAVLYRGAALVVAPSKYEGFGLPCLEAMACGAPLLYNDIPPFREVAGDAGQPVDATRAEVLADAVVGLMRDDSLRKELGRRGIARAREFDWRKTAEATRAVLEEHGK